MNTTISVSPEDFADPTALVVFLQAAAAKVGKPISQDRIQDAHDAARVLFSAMGLGEA